MRRMLSYMHGKQIHLPSVGPLRGPKGTISTPMARIPALRQTSMSVPTNAKKQTSERTNERMLVCEKKNAKQGDGHSEAF